MVKLRMKRMGRRNRPFYRICAIDQRNQRDGLTIEELGFYDPIDPDQEKGLRINTERAIYWLNVGAQPSETVASLLKRSGVDPTPGKAKLTQTAESA